MNKIDWPNIRAEYVTGAGSYADLAQAHGISLGGIKKRARAEGWATQRAEYAADAQRRAAAQSAEAVASNAAKIERIRGILIDKALTAAENLTAAPSVGSMSDFRALVDVVERLAAVTAGQDKAIERLDALISAIDRAARA